MPPAAGTVVAAPVSTPRADHESARTAIVIGAGLGGLSAAIHLRLDGWRVQVFEANATVGGRANLLVRDGFRFDTGPSLLNYPWVFEALFEAAGRRLGDYVRLLPVEPSVTFRWPDGTQLALSSHLRTLLAELERVEPGVRPGALAYMRDAAQKYRLAFDDLVTANETSYVAWLRRVGVAHLRRLSLWRSMDGQLRRFFPGGRIADALGSYGMYLGGSPRELPGFFAMLPYGELAYGLWLPEGGIYALVSAIEALAREIGVEIVTSAPVDQILAADGQVHGIQLRSGTRVPATVVVSNVDVPTTEAELLPRTGPPGRRPPPRMTPGVLTFYWGVRGRVEDVGHHTIFLPEDVRATYRELIREGRVPRDLAFYVSVPSATDPTLAPPGDAAVFVLVPMPRLSQRPWHAGDTLTASVRAAIFERFRRHGLSLTPDRIRFEEAWSPRDWADRFGLFDGSAFGAAHSLRQLGPWRSPNRDRYLRGLFYTGASTTPGTGVPLVVLSGRMTAASVRERHGVPA